MTRRDTYAVRIAPGQAARLREIARAEGRTVSFLVRAAIFEWLERRRRPACTRCGRAVLDATTLCAAAFGVPCSPPEEGR